MPIPDLWGELFRHIDQLLLFTPVVDRVVPIAQRERFLQEVKEPCHTQVYDLGWTGYLPVSRMDPDDLIS